MKLTLRRGAVATTVVVLLVGASASSAPCVGDDRRTDSVAAYAIKADADELTGSADGNNADEVDLMGNEVSHAIATYQLDSDGSLYESHSPQTMLPAVAPPKS